jgi:benzoyl-CoA reductase/2-hydroxyglutaryl-CoA dehydratase subunit BcrC/BadD/HgdB
VQGAVGQLQQAYGQPLAAAREHRRCGGRVVGYTGPTVPVELIESTGAMPVLVVPQLPRPTPLADQLIETTEPWALRSVAEQALDGSLACLDLLVLTRSEDWLYYNLKEAVRRGLGERVPELHLMDLIQSSLPAVQDYNTVVVRRLVECLERRLGRAAPDRLPAAVAAQDARRRLLRDFLQRRAASAWPGSLAMQILGASCFLQQPDWCAAVQQILSEPVTESAHGSVPGVLVATSEPLFHLRLHQAIEEAGGRVVAEDTWYGARCATPELGSSGDLLARLAQHYAVHTQNDVVQPRERRDAWVLEQLERGDVALLVLYVPPGDRRFGWDCPRLIEAAGQRAVPSVVVRSSVLDPAGHAAVVAEVRTALATAGTAGRQP